MAKLYYGDNLVTSILGGDNLSLDDAITLAEDSVRDYFGQADDWDWKDVIDADGEFIYDYEQFRLEF